MKNISKTMTVPLSVLVESAKVMMAEKGYAKKTIENYSNVWTQIIEYADTEGIKSCSDKLITQFARSRYGTPDVFHPVTDKERYYARILLCLNDFSKDGIWITHRIYNDPKQFKSRAIKETYESYAIWLKEKRLKPGSISLKQQIIRDFLIFAESKQIHNINELRLTTVRDYLGIKNGLSTSTKSGIIITIRDFFKCPDIAASLTKDLSVYLKVTNNGKYEHLPSSYSTEEIRCILMCIDRTNSEGKKDYAVILLAIDTGMRISDIINLKLSDIKWETGTIEIVQKKTEEFLCSHMSEALKWALIDYLMNARSKNIAFENVFLRSKAPISPYISAGHYYKQLNKYFTAAGIKTQNKHHGMHALRHSLATRLMQNDIPITVISQALGHKYANVTKQYIRVDIDKLRLAALEVPSND
ncbi:MAG: tyrosine-type recombinase/integrase [Oscillospiraceae bacterium]|nr:tyrosine-type recombinase/integrase [Oscillospiraceae bacterium]HBT64481.1 hypothetical protein [Oscillospiraceae bacterium]